MPNQDKAALIAQKADIESQLRAMAVPIAESATAAVADVDADYLAEIAAEARGVCDDVATQIHHFLTCLHGLRIVAQGLLAPPVPMPLAAEAVVIDDQEK